MSQPYRLSAHQSYPNLAAKLRHVGWRKIKSPLNAILSWAGTSYRTGETVLSSPRFPLVIATLAFNCVAQPAQNNLAGHGQAAACTEPQQAQFDFWIGEWDLTWPASALGNAGHGSNSIKKVMGGCVVQESFSGEAAMPLRGMSVSRFDPMAGKWKQTWVDNEGSYLDFTGNFQNSQMILQRQASRPDGTRFLQRMVWKSISARELDWSWERSLD